VLVANGSSDAKVGAPAAEGEQAASKKSNKAERLISLFI
jgi:hypothetical protein